MKLRLLFALAAPLTAAGLISSLSVAQQLPSPHGPGPDCGGIREEWVSCRLEVHTSYVENLRRCRRLESADERSECLGLVEEYRQSAELFCDEVREYRIEVCEDYIDGKLVGKWHQFFPSEPLSVTGNFILQPDDLNPYYSQRPGKTYVARGGDNLQQTIITTVTNEVRQVLGVNCRITVNLVLEKKDGQFEAVVITDHYYAQALNGDVYHCGKVVRNFENGALANLDGSFEAGRDFARSGILIKARPVTGDTHRRESARGDSEAVIHYLAGEYSPTSVKKDEGGENPLFPCQGQCVKVEVIDPLETGLSKYVYFKAGIGFVVGVALEDGAPTGERDELLCTGDSLAILTEDAYCGFDKEQLPTLMDLLCKLSPTAFCNKE